VTAPRHLLRGADGHLLHNGDGHLVAVACPCCPEGSSDTIRATFSGVVLCTTCIGGDLYRYFFSTAPSQDINDTFDLVRVDGQPCLWRLDAPSDGVLGIYSYTPCDPPANTEIEITRLRIELEAYTGGAWMLTARYASDAMLERYVFLGQVEPEDPCGEATIDNTTDLCSSDVSYNPGHDGAATVTPL